MLLLRGESQMEKPSEFFKSDKTKLLTFTKKLLDNQLLQKLKYLDRIFFSNLSILSLKGRFSTVFDFIVKLRLLAMKLVGRKCWHV